MTETETGVLIVGAGPIGIELAVALKRAVIPYVHLDAGQIGSTIEWYAPGTHFFSSPERLAIAGVPLQTLDQTKATREEYLSYLRSVVMQFGLRIETYERVTKIYRRQDGTFDLTSTGAKGQRSWHARKVVLAIGDMHRPRKIGVPGEDLPHVSHYFRDPHTYFRRNVVIVGGKNSAVEAAIRCVRVGANVTLVHRGEDFDPDRVKFWLLPEIRALIRDGRIEFLPQTLIREIRTDRVFVERQGTSSRKEARRELPADFVLLMTGYEQDENLFVQSGIALEGEARRPKIDERTMESSVPGLYVAGTAIAGTQTGGAREFIETSHIHVDRILAALKGEPAPDEKAPEYMLPES